MTANNNNKIKQNKKRSVYMSNVYIYLQASTDAVWYFIKNSENVTKIWDVDVFNYFFKDLAWFTCFCLAISSSIKLFYFWGMNKKWWDLFKKRCVYYDIIINVLFLHIFFQDFPKLNIVGWKMVCFCLTFHQNTFTRSNQCPAPMLATIDVTPKIVWAPLFPKRSGSPWHVRNLFTILMGSNRYMKNSQCGNCRICSFTHF